MRSTEYHSSMQPPEKVLRSSSLSLLDLNFDVIERVVHYLKRSELAKLAMVSKSCRDLFYDSRLWRNTYVSITCSQLTAETVSSLKQRGILGLHIYREEKDYELLGSALDSFNAL